MILLTSKVYERPQTIEEAYTLAQKKQNVVLGGMGWLKMQNRSVNTLIDLSDLHLDEVVEDDVFLEMGCMVSLRQLETDNILRANLHDYFHEVCKGIVGVQFRNTVTLGGSVFGRFGFSDIITALLVCDAEVQLQSVGWIKLSDFLTTKREADLLLRVRIPKVQRKLAYEVERLSASDFPIVNVAVSREDDVYKIAIGARPSIASLKQISVRDVDVTSFESCMKSIESIVLSYTFLDNSRASAKYREHLATVLLARAIMRLEDNHVSED